MFSKLLNLHAMIMLAADMGSSNGSTQAGQVQSQVIANQFGPEARRKLSTVPYVQSAQASVDIPRDTVIKRINLQFSAAMTVTYAAGSPILSPLGLFARLVPQCTVNADGSRNIKVLDLYMNRCLNALAYEDFARRAYATGAGLVATTRQPTSEWLAGGIAYPATTQDIIVNESTDIMFENYFAYETGRAISLLYTKNLSTCTLGFQFAAIGQANTDGNAAAVTYSAIDVSIVPTIIENRDADISNGSYDFVETVIRKQFPQQVSQFAVDLNTGNKLVGIGMMARNGDTAKTLSDTVVTDLNLVVNGATSIQATRFKDLMNDNQGRYGVGKDSFAAGVHPLNGFAYMNLLKNGNIFSGLDTRLVSGVSQVQLLVSTASSTGIDAATYTNPVEVSFLQQQLIPVPIKA